MGKGKDGCNSSDPGMGISGMLDPLPELQDNTSPVEVDERELFAFQQALLVDEDILNTSSVSSEKISSDKKRYKNIEEFEKKWASDTLTHADKMRASGVNETDIIRYFDRREEDLEEKIQEQLIEWFDSSERDNNDLELNQVASILAATSVHRVYEDVSRVPGRELLGEFMNSDEFISNFKKVIAYKTDFLNSTVTEKNMENANRDAALLTIGIYDSDETTGYWRAPSGDEYIMEVVRSAGNIDLMDLVIVAMPINGEKSQISTLQFKSYKTTSSKSSDTTAGKERINKTGSLKIKRVCTLNGPSRYSLEKAARETQIRVLATSVYNDSSVHEQIDQNREPEASTSVASVTDPNIHKAIARAKDLPAMFRPAKRSDGSYGFLEAKIECTNSFGEPCVVKIQTTMSAQLGDDGEPLFDTKGVCLVDHGESAGNNTGEISLDISLSGWHRLHKVSLLSRARAKAIINTPGKLEEYDIRI